MIKMSLILPHLHPLNFLPILLSLNNLSVFNPNWGDFHVEPKKVTLEDNVEVVPFPQHSTFGNPKPKPSPVGLVNPILNSSQFTLTFMPIFFYLITHLKMWINHVISVIPPASLTVWMN